MNGKGSSPRNCFSRHFYENYDRINWRGLSHPKGNICHSSDGSKPRKSGDDRLQKHVAGNDDKRNPNRAHRLIADNDGHWYIIRADEEKTFYHWLLAMEGKRHFPGDFNPTQVNSPESVRFCGYWKDAS